jgi:hypothetical protein
VLGNPAGLTLPHTRAEALVSDLETPDAMGLRALTAAGAVRVHGAWTVGAAYRHLGVGDMLRTDGPPLGPNEPTFEVAEDVYAVGVGYLAGLLAAGASIRLDTPAEELGGDATWSGRLGASLAPRLPFVGLQLAGAVELADDDPSFAGAAEVSAPPLLDERLALALAYGVQQHAPLGVAHSLVASGVWRGVAELQIGTSAQPGAGDAAWVPLLAGLLHLGRYRVGVVREHLPNGFGAAMHYRLSVVF